MKLKDQALSLAFAGAFLTTLVGQSIAGLFAYNEEQLAHGASETTWYGFVTSSYFVVDVAENWQSEYLQFFLFILATVWLVQRGSPESKKPGDEGVGTDEEQQVGEFAGPDSPSWARADGLRLWIYSNSLLIVMGAIFVFSWLAQCVAGTTVYNAEQIEHGLPPLSLGEYLLSAGFWNRTLQNWQSELLAVGSMVAFTIYLRQRGSAESTCAGTPRPLSAIESE